ncbi:MAG: Cation/multidrug efflux pump, partial [Chthonomonadaceae bacterium]|nr:Cation/multidrug efflux pump [Chthonomonadaceae bacterium]
MNLSRFATGHLKAVLFVTVVLCVIGGIMLTSFPVAILPDVTFPRIKVIAEAGDRPSRMVEAGITRQLEEAVATVPGVHKVKSTTERGATEVAIDFDWGVDIPSALQLVTAKV